MSLLNYFETLEGIGVLPSGFKGCKLPVLPSGIEWKGTAPPGYEGTSTDYFEWLYIDDERKKIWQSDLFARQNAINENMRKSQHLLHLLNFAANGLEDIYYAPLGNYTKQVTYLLAGVSGNVITCIYASGNVDPNSIPNQVFTINPDYPAEPNRLDVTGFNTKLRPNGKATFSEPSLLASHAGFHVKSVSVPSGLGYGGTFDLICSNNVEGVETIFPSGAAGDIYVNYRFYIAGGMEPWELPVDIDPLWSEPSGISISNFSQEVELIDKRIVYWDNADYFAAAGYASGNLVSDLTEQVKPYMRIVHTPSGYSTKVDLSSLSLSADEVRFNVYAESKEDTAEYAGCNQRCKHCIYDYSKSYADTFNNWYCRKAATASGINDFKENCYQPGQCNEFEKDLPTDPVSTGLLKNLYMDQPWQVRQIAAGIPTFEIRRFGTPSISSLAEINLNVPTAYVPSIGYWYGRGGWTDYDVITEDGDESIRTLKGHEQAWQVLPSGQLLFAAWEDKAADLISAANTEPNKAMSLTNTPSLAPYFGNVVGNFGAAQRCSDTDCYGLIIPEVDKTNPIQSFVGGNIIYGKWDSDFEPTEASGVYNWLIALNKGTDLYSRTRNLPTVTKFTTKVLDQELDSGYVWLELENRPVTLTSINGVQSNISSSFRAGGTNVRLLDNENLNNMDCWTSRRGADRGNYAYPGDTLYNSDLNLHCWITDVDPISASGNQSWITTTTQDIESIAPDLYFKAFDNASETLTSVVIKRNSGAVTLTGYTEDGGVPIIPSILTAKDTYWFQEGFDLTSKGVYIKFSNANLTSSSADYTLDVTITTDAKSYNYTLDIYADANNRLTHNLITDYDITSIDSVRLYWTDELGEQQTQLLTFAAATYFADLDETEYSYSVINSKNYLFGFNANVTGCNRIEITATLQNPTWTESTWYDWYVAPHAISFPPSGIAGDFSVYGKYGDRVKIWDENDYIKDSGFSFVGLDVDIKTNGVMYPSGVVTLNDTPEEASMFGAEGLIFGKTNLSNGDEIKMELPLADRKGMLKAEEMNNITSSIYGLLGGE